MLKTKVDFSPIFVYNTFERFSDYISFSHFFFFCVRNAYFANIVDWIHLWITICDRSFTRIPNQKWTLFFMISFFYLLSNPYVCANWQYKKCCIHTKSQNHPISADWYSVLDLSIAHFRNFREEMKTKDDKA